MANEIARREDDRTILIDDAHIMFRNFSGAPDKFNALGGKRYFHAVIPPQLVATLEEQGYNIKYLKPREEGDLPTAHLKISINTEGRQPPKVYVVNSKGRRQLTPEMFPMLDWADFGRIDLIWNRYTRQWPDGRTTTTAYLQTFFGFVREDELEQRYSEIPDLDMGELKQIDDGNPEIQTDVLVWKESTPAEIEELKILEALNAPSYDD